MKGIFSSTVLLTGLIVTLSSAPSWGEPPLCDPTRGTGFNAQSSVPSWREPPHHDASIDERAAHVVTVDPDGVSLDPTTYAPLTSEQFEEQLRMIAGAIEASGKTQVLVFVHGGLNNREAGQRDVDELLQPMSESKEHYYPLFLNWNSDLVDTSIEQLLYIRQGRTSRYLGPLSSPFAVLAALGSGLLRAPLVWGELLANDLNTTGIKALTFPGKRNSEALAEELFALYRQGNPAAIPNEF